MLRILTFYTTNKIVQILISVNMVFKLYNMPIRLKLIQGLNHTKLLIHLEFQPLVIISSLFTCSILSIFALSVL